MWAAALSARWWTIISLVAALAVLANWLPQLAGEVRLYRANVSPLLRRWSDPLEQARLAVGSPPLVDTLIEADRLLPPDASVVFLTAGQDVDATEYVAFHRALYYLSPRPVWWVTQTAEVQSERRPRWYQSQPPGDAQWLLAYQVDPAPTPGAAVDLASGSKLFWRGGGPPPLVDRTPALWASPAWPIGAALALLTLLASGWALLALLEPLGLRPGRVESVALAWALGAVAVSVGLLLGCAIGLGLRRSTFILAALACGGCVWLRRGTPLRVEWCRRLTPSGLAPAALALCLGLILVYVALLADGRPLQVWDSWVTWGMKARLIWQTDGIPPGVYADPTRAVTLPSYPLLVPLLEAWLFTWIGAPDDRLAGLIAVGMYAVLLGLVFSALRTRGAGVLVALLGAAYVASIWPLAGLAGLAFADVPLAVFALLAGIYLVRWLEDGLPAALILAAVACGALAWTKREGLVLLLLFILMSLVSSRSRPGGWRGAPALALGGLLVAGPWLAFVTWRGLPDWQFIAGTPQVAIENRERLTFVLGTLARSSVDPAWSFVWLLGVLGLGLALAQGPRPFDLIPLLAAAYLALLSASYLFSAFVPYQTHVLASVGRLMAHVAPLVGFWLLSRWLELRPAPALGIRTAETPPRRARDGAAPSVPPGSSTGRRTPALEGLGRGSRPRSSLRLPPGLGRRRD